MVHIQGIRADEYPPTVLDFDLGDWGLIALVPGRRELAAITRDEIKAGDRVRP